MGIEVKAAETVRTVDFRGLKRLQTRLGKRFLAGFVLYCGSESLPYGDGFGLPPDLRRLDDAGPNLLATCTKVWAGHAPAAHEIKMTLPRHSTYPAMDARVGGWE